MTRPSRPGGTRRLSDRDHRHKAGDEVGGLGTSLQSIGITGSAPPLSRSSPVMAGLVPAIPTL
ncbi:hypothetical protein J4G37_01765 [Microvirga sp. 3-52]|nr:hypothetical protein [Microvirga sp. 3-52]